MSLYQVCLFIKYASLEIYPSCKYLLARARSTHSLPDNRATLLGFSSNKAYFMPL